MEKQNTKPRYYIGIDCGTKTGIAVWDSLDKKFLNVTTLKLHQALDFVRRFYTFDMCSSEGLHVLIENPNTFIPFKGREKQNRAKEQGAGSIKRDYAIWRDALTDWGIGFRGTSLHGSLKKIDSDTFRIRTGYMGKTSEHARDAAMIVFGR